MAEEEDEAPVAEECEGLLDWLGRYSSLKAYAHNAVELARELEASSVFDLVLVSEEFEARLRAQMPSTAKVPQIQLREALKKLKKEAEKLEEEADRKEERLVAGIKAFAPQSRKEDPPAKGKASREGQGQGPYEFFEVVQDAVFIKAEPTARSATVGRLEFGTFIQVQPKGCEDADDAGQMWVELTAEELCRHEGDPRSGFCPIDWSHMGLGKFLRGPVPRAEKNEALLKWEALGVIAAAKKKSRGSRLEDQHVEESSSTEKKTNAPLDLPPGMTEEKYIESVNSFAAQFKDVPRSTMLFQSCKAAVFVKTKTHKDAPTIGVLKNGQIVQIARIVKNVDQKDWAELTNFELWQSCEPETTDDTGFVLIDGAHLGLGRLLRGPLPRSDDGALVVDDQALPSTRKGENAQATGKAAASEAETSVAQIAQQIVDLPPQDLMILQMQDMERKQQDALEEANAQASMKQDPRKLYERMKRVSEKREMLAEQTRYALEQPVSSVGGNVYRAVQPWLYIKWSADPSSEMVTRAACPPGMKVGSTDETWQGRDGSLWIQLTTRDGRNCWVLKHGPGNGTMILEAEECQDYVQREIWFDPGTQKVRIFDAYVSQSSTVGALKAQFCAATGLKPRLTALVLHATSPACLQLESQSALPAPSIQEFHLADNATLKEAFKGVPGSSDQSTLLAVYLDMVDFERDFMPDVDVAAPRARSAFTAASRGRPAHQR